MTQFIAIVQLVLQLFPILVSTVKSIEEAIPASGQGAAKLQIIRTVLESAFSTIQDVTVTFEQVWPSIEKVVASVVQIYNTLGTFKKQ